ncbi:hypothetical protein CsSME_00009504 [Camellia sinensis var. sinensis]
MRKVVGSSSPPHEVSPAISSRNLSFNAEMIKQLSWQNSTESAKSISDNDEGDKDGINEHEEVEPTVEASGWHSDNELNTKGFPPRVVKRGEEIRSLDPEKKHGSDRESPSVSLGGYPASGFPVSSDHLEDPVVALPEVPSSQKTAFCFLLCFMTFTYTLDLPFTSAIFGHFLHCRIVTLVLSLKFSPCQSN